MQLFIFLFFTLFIPSYSLCFYFNCFACDSPFLPIMSTFLKRFLGDISDVLLFYILSSSYSSTSPTLFLLLSFSLHSITASQLLLLFYFRFYRLRHLLLCNIPPILIPSQNSRYIYQVAKLLCLFFIFSLQTMQKKTKPDRHSRHSAFTGDLRVFY